MPLYRIHQKLLVDSTHGVFVEPGGACTLDMVSKSSIRLLLDIGAISLVQAPSLDTFTHWRGRARKLDSLGIDTIAFVTMDAKDIAYAIRASSSQPTENQQKFDNQVSSLTLAVKRWQGEVREFLGISSAKVRR